METYSYDLRERVVRACDEGRGTRQAIAEWFGVSTAWIRRLLQRRRDTGSFAAKPRGGSVSRIGGPQLTAAVAATPDATLAELRNQLGLTVHRSTLSRALARLDLTFKKK
jgi:transposase